MLKDYILKLEAPLNQSMIDDFHLNNYQIVFHDDILPDLVIVHGSKVSLDSFDFVERFRESRRNGTLLSNTTENKAKTIVDFTPSIDTEKLNTFGHGFGVGVAVLDCGLIPAIATPVEENEDFTGFGKSPYRSPQGTMPPHADIVVNIIRHFSKAARIYNAKVCHQDGTLNETHVFNGLKWARSKENVRIINMSIGWHFKCDGSCDLARYINAIYEKQQIVVVSAMGNKFDGQDYFTFCPACASEAVSVGAVSEDGNTIAHFSVPGHINSMKPNIVAAGNGKMLMGEFFTPFHGTSFAAPVITGILASLVSYTGDMEKLRMRLYETASYMEGIPSNYQGLGKLDLLALLEVLSNEQRIDSASS
jgi:Subtilisin-like serine proteases